MFQRPFFILSLALTTIAFACILSSYFLVIQPDSAIQIFWDGPIDNLHRILTIAIGAWMAVTGIMAVLSLLRPHKQRGLITLLVTTHLAIFVVDIVIIARGLLESRLVFIEIAYCILMCVLLVRFFPSEKQLELFRDAREHQKREKKEEKERLKAEKEMQQPITVEEGAEEKSEPEVGTES